MEILFRVKLYTLAVEVVDQVAVEVKLVQSGILHVKKIAYHLVILRKQAALKVVNGALHIVLRLVLLVIQAVIMDAVINGNDLKNKYKKLNK